MDIRHGSLLAELVDSAGDSQRAGIERAVETASRFPESVEEYMELSVEDRVKMASDMVSTYYPFYSYEKFDVYADYPPEKSVSAKVPTDKPGIIINSSIAYDSGEYTKAMNSVFTERGPALFVWAHAEDATDGSRSSSKQLGKIRVNGDSSAFEKLEKKTFDLDDPRAIEMIEIIDAAAANLITGIVAEQRSQASRIGAKALQSSAITG